MKIVALNLCIWLDNHIPLGVLKDKLCFSSCFLTAFDSYHTSSSTVLRVALRLQLDPDWLGQSENSRSGLIGLSISQAVWSSLNFEITR